MHIIFEKYFKMKIFRLGKIMYLLQNKQLIINQLKTNNLVSRTINEGSLDEQSGMNFSKYVAILSDNTNLLVKRR
jgi:hypothetical protein